jgi:hypothetical protein
MKSKALTYVMVIIVGIIWYQVFFRVKDNLSGEDTEIPKPNESFASVRIISRDTVDLNVDYRDPFNYEKMARPVAIGNDMNDFDRNPRPIPQRSRKPEFVWPKVTYHGLIRNRSSKSPLGLVRLDGLVYHLRIGEEIYNEIYVKSIGTEELVLRYKKLSKAIYKD